VRGRQGLLGLEGLLAAPQAGEAQGVGLDGGGAPTARIYRRAEGPNIWQDLGRPGAGRRSAHQRDYPPGDWGDAGGRHI